MGRKRTGGWFERDGRRMFRVRIGPKIRPTVELSGCLTDLVADERVITIAGVVARLLKAGKPEMAENAVRELAKAPTPDEVAGFVTVIEEICAGDRNERPKFHAGLKLRVFAAQWINSELAAEFPDHVAIKKTSDDDKFRFNEHIDHVIGHLPVSAITLDLADEVMSKLPRGLSAASRRHVAQILGRLMALAAYPARLIPVSPIPKGWLPKLSGKTAFSFLYPSEDAKLMACKDVPIAYRLLEGVLEREGLRVSEAIGLTWSMLDLENGAIRCDVNKTEDPRTWALDAGVARALAWWKKSTPKPAPTDFVFVQSRVASGVKLGEPIRFGHAQLFRDHLALAKITRPELTERTKARRPIRIHDLRATFVTLSLAAGKSEAWVTDRTGHTSSYMLNRYKRAARTVGELRLGTLAPLDQAIPEIAGK